MNNKLKVIHINWNLTLGGAENLLVDIVNEQAKHLLVSLIIVNNHYDRELVSQVAPSVPIKMINRVPGSKNVFSIIKLNSIVLANQPDIIHFHEHKLIRLLPFRKMMTHQAGLTVHNTLISCGNLGKYDVVFAISDTVRSEIMEKCDISSRVVINGISFNKIRKKISSCCQGKNLFSIIQIGRLDHAVKGQHILLQSLAILVHKYGVRDINVTFIGDGKSKEFLGNQANSLNVRGYCDFLGKRDRNYIYAHLADFDLLVQPSLYEGFGLTIVEAMAAGIPVLVSDINGPKEVVENGRYGFMFRVGDAEDLASQILGIKKEQNGEALQEKVKQSYNYALGRFDVKATALRYIEEYENLNNGGK